MDFKSKLEQIKNAEIVDGKHFTEYVDKVRNLKRQGDYIELEKLLYKLIEATEAGDRISHWGVAPWYYEELAKLYRKNKDFQSEVDILERYSINRHAPGVKPKKLLVRLEKAKVLLQKNNVNKQF